mmetsp:Transcript_50897/g.143273  ORF Transcript_50897/g.143273 Transcript_50897/m.143273 type:complete len:125 (-) Transcript_50897:165-539(-)|eukprot:CAMPEP_0179306580 /NCGR_PEP_ID=MMETSP0797-20121207/50205_1 /TAXON_ID=47934 /ORGANISM="Dinophysis acuminata, Strain DAEP01" /LENGTH=124 /DNA_ID=CAMNT_0021016249 /DNA_START=54 /DNA_END=428 /DNA_ORIENTATION=-
MRALWRLVCVVGVVRAMLMPQAKQGTEKAQDTDELSPEDIDHLFGEMDTDEDGMFSLQEMIKASEEPDEPVDEATAEQLSGWFAAADEDKDGLISIKELPAFYRRVREVEMADDGEDIFGGEEL